VGYRTPAIAWLQSDTELFRLTTYVGGSEKTFNANAGMIYDLADVRGYDSIIPRQYVAYMSLIQEQVELPYNRIAPIIETHPEALDSPLLDLLNVKYVLTDGARAIARLGYTLVYEGEVRIYRNDDYLPRAFLVPRAVVIPDGAEREAALRRLNPREVVILEEPPAQPQGAEAQDFSGQVEAIHYTANEVLLTVQARAPCFLVLADSYFPGWLAFIRPPEAADPARAEQNLPIYRADGNFRAVQVPAGRHVVRFKYSPNSVKYGLYLCFLAGITLVLALAAWAWARLYRGGEEEEPAKRVTKNTLAPIGLSLLNKIIDMAFAMLMLRILGPADAGAYYLAINIIGWFDIITNFGLNALLTREIAKERSQANRYLTNATLLRLGLCLASAPILAIFFLVRRWTAPLEPRTILAIALFGVALLPGNISAGLSAMFTAYERMEIPAGITTLTTLLKVSLGTLALVLGTGYLGLAGVSIVVNLITMGILYGVLRATLFRPRLELDWSAQKRMLQDSYPLMVNNLLATLFFKVAVLLLEWILKDLAIVGWYSTAYKYIDAVGVIPAYFTIALFPLMSRYAAEAKGSLYKAYLLALKLLLMVAVPGAWLGWALSKELITLLGGAQYLPYAAQILKVMIWYMPIGFINSVTQYVLIALDQQRFLTRAFAIGLAFNVMANVLLIGRFGFMAAAYVAVASELVLLIPFYVGVRRHLARIPWLELAGKQALCALPLGALLVFLPHRQGLLAIPLGLACYGLGMRVLGVLSAEEREVVGRVLPLHRFQAKLAALWARRVD